MAARGGTSEHLTARRNGGDKPRSSGACLSAFVGSMLVWAFIGTAIQSFDSLVLLVLLCQMCCSWMNWTGETSWMLVHVLSQTGEVRTTQACVAWCPLVNMQNLC